MRWSAHTCFTVVLVWAGGKNMFNVYGVLAMPNHCSMVAWNKVGNGGSGLKTSPYNPCRPACLGKYPWSSTAYRFIEQFNSYGEWCVVTEG